MTTKFIFYMNKQINLLLFIVTSAAFLLHESPSTKLPYKNIYFKSELFGTKVGQEFSWVSTLNNGQIREISCHSGWYLDQIQTKMADESQEESSPSIGGKGGLSSSWKVPDRQYISKVITKSKDWLIEITFETNKGSQSPTFGGNDDKELQDLKAVVFKLPKNTRLAGLYGYTEKFIKGIGFHYKHLTTPIFGDNTGTQFSWWAKASQSEIKVVTVIETFQVDQIKIECDNGTVRQISPYFGNKTGHPNSWLAVKDQYINKIIIKKDTYIKSIVFVTNKGVHSPLFGGKGGDKTEEYLLQPGQRLIGIFGNTNRDFDEEHLLFAVGFFIGEGFPMTMTKTDLFGNSLLGKTFQWNSFNKVGKLARIEGRADGYINILKFYLTNGEESGYVGGNGGIYFDYVVPKDEYVSQVTFKTSIWLDSITFTTNKGKMFKIGGDGGNMTSSIEILEGTHIVGFYGTQNNGYFPSLGLFLAS